MELQKITPEAYEKTKKAELEARERRNFTICQMRASDPDYWTVERLAGHWNMSKQSISYICLKGGVEKG